jgi:hypothetical protein
VGYVQTSKPLKNQTNKTNQTKKTKHKKKKTKKKPHNKNDDWMPNTGQSIGPPDGVPVTMKETHQLRMNPLSFCSAGVKPPSPNTKASSHPCVAPANQKKKKKKP